MRFLMMTSVATCLAILPYFLSPAVNADLPSDQCPTVKEIKDFNSTMLTGQWSYYFWNQESLYQCNTISLTPIDQGKIQDNEYYMSQNTGELRNFNVTLAPKTVSSQFSFEKNYDESYLFVEVVPDSYIIFVDCTVTSFSRWTLVGATSAKNTPSAEVINQMKATVTNFGVSESSLKYLPEPEKCN